MTETEAKAKGMSDLDIAMGILMGDIEPEEKPSLMERLHGKVVGSRMDPYHDVTIYEDGYEDRHYIGD